MGDRPSDLDCLDCVGDEIGEIQDGYIHDDRINNSSNRHCAGGRVGDVAAG